MITDKIDKYLNESFSGGLQNAIYDALDMLQHAIVSLKPDKMDKNLFNQINKEYGIAKKSLNKLADLFEKVEF
jgi:hypothetical protein